MAATVANDARQRLAEISRTNPEWDAWLSLLKETLGEANDPAWESIEISHAERRVPHAPLLDGATVTVDGRRARKWVHYIFEVAAEVLGPRANDMNNVYILEDSVPPTSLLETVVRQDEVRSGEQAHALDAGPELYGAVANLAAMPLLQACRRKLEGQAPADWPHGHCPTCGAWATLAEKRGIEQDRRLRCARCGDDWATENLRCAYCGESNGVALGALVPEETGDTRKADTCDSCKGYTKSVAALSAWPPYTVALEDLASVDLDLIAIERGYGRPNRPGYAVDVRIVAAPERKRGLFRWRS